MDHSTIKAVDLFSNEQQQFTEQVPFLNHPDV